MTTKEIIGYAINNENRKCVYVCINCTTETTDKSFPEYDYGFDAGLHCEVCKKELDPTAREEEWS